MKLNSANDVYQSPLISEVNNDIPDIRDKYFSNLSGLSFPSNLNQNILVEKHHFAEGLDFEYWVGVTSLWFNNQPFLVSVYHGDQYNSYEWITNAALYEKAFEYIVNLRIKEIDVNEADPNQPIEELTFIDGQHFQIENLH